MEGIGERLKLLRKEIGLKQGEFASKLGLKQGSYSDIENGKETLTSRNMKLLCLEFKVNEEWLINGKGSMFTADRGLSRDAKDLLEIFDKLYSNNQQKIIEYAQEKLDLQELREQTGNGEKGEDMADSTRKIG